MKPSTAGWLFAAPALTVTLADLSVTLALPISTVAFADDGATSAVPS